MIEFIIGIVAGFISGLLVKPVYNMIFHTHNYEVLFNRRAQDMNINFNCTYQAIPSKTMVVYKKCSICGKEHINISDGSQADFGYNYDLVLSLVKATIKKESNS